MRVLTLFARLGRRVLNVLDEWAQLHVNLPEPKPSFIFYGLKKIDPIIAAPV
jgi:hypothetical protein